MRKRFSADLLDRLLKKRGLAIFPVTTASGITAYLTENEPDPSFQQPVKVSQRDEVSIRGKSKG
jgi:hypothetical protein